ncbi:MAG TPA: hypothetical protein VKY24_06825 [Reyranella sp.]|jgi:hypothetical protein|nr:hypothetical protein [Reyranella sp.]
MRGLTKINGQGEQRARVSDELRQLKQMSKGLRTKSIQSLIERHAAQRLERKPKTVPLAERARPAAAA